MDLDNILFISLPEGFNHRIDDFIIDPSIRLPVEIPLGSTAESWSPETLSWEMIVAGMLKILAHNPTHADIDYFGAFVLAVQPDAIVELTASGIAKSKQQEFNLAQELFLAVLALQKEPGHYLNVAFCFGEESGILEDTASKQEALDRAFFYYKAGLEEFPKSPDLHYYTAQFYVQQESFSKALTHYKAFLTFSDKDDSRREQVKTLVEKIEENNPFQGTLASALDMIHMGKEQEAVEILESYLEDQPGDWNTYFLLGWALRRTSQYSKAKSAFLRAKKENPTEVDILNEIAICSMELGDFASAESALIAGLELDAENIKILSNLGVLALKQDNKDDAMGYFRVAQDIDPEDSVVKHYLQELEKEE